MSHVVGLKALVDPEVPPKVLILGTLPGGESITQQCYYANKRNCFWKIMGEILNGKGSSEGVNVNSVTKFGIALWDVLEEADRNGSGDASIKNEKPNDLAAFLNKYSTITHIVLNGKGKTWKYFNKYFGYILAEKKVNVHAFYSTSAACCKAADGKRDWMQIKDFLK